MKTDDSIQNKASEIRAKYQYAFLFIQNSLNALTKLVRYWETRSKLAKFQKWAESTVYCNCIQTAQIEASYQAFNLQLCSLETSLKSHLNSNLYTAFLKIKQQHLVLQTKEKTNSDVGSFKTHQNAKLSKLQQDQEELLSKENQLNQKLQNLKQKEDSFKEKIRTLTANSSRQKTRKRSSEEKLDEEIKDLRQENAKLSEKLSAIEGNVNDYIKEMSGLLEVKQRSPSKKSLKKKGKGKSGKPLITLDLAR